MTNPTQPLDLETMREVALKATPGPWQADYDAYGDEDTGRVEGYEPSGDFLCATGIVRLTDEANAEHIATFDPPTVLALLDALSSERAAREEAERERDHLSDQLAEAQDFPWPEWATSIRTTLLQYGADLDDDDGTCDLGDAFDAWVDDFGAEYDAFQDRALAAEAQVSALQAQVDGLREAIKPFYDLAIATTVEGSPDYRTWVADSRDWMVVFSFSGCSINLGQLRALAAERSSMKVIDAALNRQDNQHG